MATLNKETQLTQTKGTWEARGKLFNTKSEHAFKVNDAGTWRTVNLGLRLSDSEIMFFTVKGGEKKEVYLSKRGEKKGDKTETKKVDWKDRFKESRGGWSPIGVNLGLTKNEEGKNEIVSKTEWDAFDYLKENATENMDVHVVGEIEFSTYKTTDKDGNETVKKFQNFVAKKIYLANDPIDFQSDKFEKTAGFVQTFILLAPHKEESKELGMQYFLEVGFVGYGSYETTLVECTEKIYTTLKEKGMRPYQSVDFTGIMKTSVQAEQVAVKDTWGEESKVGTNKTPAKTTLLITGARGETLEKEIYVKKNVDAYLEILRQVEEEKAKKKAGFASQESGDWGDKSGVVKEEETPW